MDIMEKQKDYADRLRTIRDMEGEKLSKLKFLFQTFNPPCHQTIMQFLAREKLKGNDEVSRKEIIAYARDVFNFDPPLITISLRRMFYLGVLEKGKVNPFLEKEVTYALSEMFEEISKAVCILEDLLEKVSPEQLDVYRRNINYK